MYSLRNKLFFLIMYVKHEAVLEILKVEKAENLMLEPCCIYWIKRLKTHLILPHISLSVLNILLLNIEVTSDLASQGIVEYCLKNNLIAHFWD